MSGYQLQTSIIQVGWQVIRIVEDLYSSYEQNFWQNIEDQVFAKQSCS